MHFVSFKHYTCVAFADLVHEDTFKHNRVFFVTPAGIISGVLASHQDDDASDLGEKAYKAVLRETHNVFQHDIEATKGNIRAPHDGCLLLRDVEVHPLDQPLSAPIIARMKNCVLFSDSVIAVFLADVSLSQIGEVQAKH